MPNETSTIEGTIRAMGMWMEVDAAAAKEEAEARRSAAACCANSAENETQDSDPCPHCGSLKDPWFSRVEPMAYVCEDCGNDWDAPPDDSLHNARDVAPEGLPPSHCSASFPVVKEK